MSIAPRASACVPADVEAWLDDLGLTPLERADREGVTSWDLVLDGRRRAALRVTLILDPTLALICWSQFAPPIGDAFRRSYRTLLRWNDELPFVKFSIGEDERPLLIAEIPIEGLDRDRLGVALARQLAVADRFHEASAAWLKAGGWPTGRGAGALDGPGVRLLTRYASSLGELLDEAEPVVGEETTA
jgi:Putative bacterial sensory transduction regulator